MTSRIVPDPDASQRVALIAHDGMKDEMLAWASDNREALLKHTLMATATTGGLLIDKLGLKVEALKSGPLGGDLQIGARISEGLVDVLVFFWDPLRSQPHDPDVKALLRVAVVWNIPTACNRATADVLIASPLLAHAHEARPPLLAPAVDR